MGVIYRSAASSSSSVLDPAASTWKRGVELVWRGPLFLLFGTGRLPPPPPRPAFLFLDVDGKMRNSWNSPPPFLACFYDTIGLPNQPCGNFSIFGTEPQRAFFRCFTFEEFCGP